jgi:hypothetical protein
MQVISEASGPNAGAAIEVLSSYFESIWRVCPQVTERPPRGPERDGVTLTIVGIDFALPEAMLAAMAMLDRARIKRCVTVALREMRCEMWSMEDRAVLRVGVATVDLRSATADDLLDALVDQAKKGG